MSSKLYSSKKGNPTKYRMFFNYDNDNKVYVVPVLPEKITLTVKGKTTSVDIDKFGEILHRGKRDSITASFESFFPRKYGKNYCACREKEFKKPKAWHAWVVKLENAEKPCHFVLVGSPLDINIYADITSYVPREEGGDVGTIYYKIEFKEHREPSVGTYKKGKKKGRKKSSGSRSSNRSKPKKYKVVKGDSLSKIVKKLKKKYSVETTKSALYKKNKSVIEKAAKKHGKSSSNNGRLLYAGTKLTIP